MKINSLGNRKAVLLKHMFFFAYEFVEFRVAVTGSKEGKERGMGYKR